MGPRTRPTTVLHEPIGPLYKTRDAGGLLHPVVVHTQTHSVTTAAAAADNDDDDGSRCDVTAAHPERPLLSTSSATWFVFHFSSAYDESFAINA